MPHLETAAFRACGHCPPLIADARSPRHFGNHVASVAECLLPQSLCSSTAAKSTRRVPSRQWGAPTSQCCGASPGMVAVILAKRHLRTERLTASEMAAGGSNMKFQASPRSSTTSFAERHRQPSLRIEAIIAATGPVTFAQHEDAPLPTLRLAMRNARAISSGLNQPSHHAMAQCASGAVCARKAGSSVPLLPSRVNKVASGFLPPACGAAALAIWDEAV